MHPYILRRCGFTQGTSWLVAPIPVTQSKEPVVQKREPAGDVDAVILHMCVAKAIKA